MKKAKFVTSRPGTVGRDRAEEARDLGKTTVRPQIGVERGRAQVRDRGTQKAVEDVGGQIGEVLKVLTQIATAIQIIGEIDLPDDGVEESDGENQNEGDQ